ncbi:MAG: class I SAM-dependent methyltransferase [Planctomycetes bacterium]|nr:class I SAM-dependent methyltransferase [Planctomycetota bacterium]
MTANPFDTAAATWDDNPHRVRLMRTLGEAIVREAAVTPEMDVLDYGCGTGLLGLFLLDHAASVTGADNSPGMLDVLRGKIAADGLEAMSVLLLDLERDAVPDRRFDLVVVGMALHHIADVDRVLRAFHTMLRPGGTLCIADLDPEGGAFHGGAAHAVSVHHHGFDRQALRDRLTRLGFADPRAVTAVRFHKPVADGGQREFTIFLITARRP